MQKQRMLKRVEETRWNFLAPKFCATRELPAACMAWVHIVTIRVSLLPTAVAAAETMPRLLMQELM